MQLVSLHSKTNNYLKRFGLFWLNYKDTNNCLILIIYLTDLLTKQELDGLHFLYSFHLHYCFYKHIE